MDPLIGGQKEGDVRRGRMRGKPGEDTTKWKPISSSQTAVVSPTMYFSLVLLVLEYGRVRIEASYCMWYSLINMEKFLHSLITYLPNNKFALQELVAKD